MSDEAGGKENADIAYIKLDDIGVIIFKGIVKTYNSQSQDPVDYLAKWLLKFANEKNKANRLLEQNRKSRS